MIADLSVKSNLDRQIVVRIPKEMHQALTRDAAENGRTLAQSVRFLLARALPKVER